MGSYVNVMYLVIENRVPPHKLGNSFVYMFTISVLIASTSPYAAYSPDPWPGLILIASLVTLFLISTKLDQGGKYINKLADEYG